MAASALPSKGWNRSSSPSSPATPPRWGYTRLRGALKNVGYTVGRNTIKRILKEQGIAPAPLRRRPYSWATFIKAHLSAITAADFFTVEVLSWVGLVRPRQRTRTLRS